MMIPSFIGINRSKSSSGNWTPAQITTECWLKADAGVVLNGSTVSQWSDYSGNNRHAVQANASNQPTYYASDSRMNGLPSIGNSSNLNILGLITPSFTAQEIYAVSVYKDGLASTFSSFTCLFENATNINNRIMGNNGTSSWIGSNPFATSANTYKNASSTPTHVALPMPASQFRFVGNATITWGIGTSFTQINRSWEGLYSEFIFLASPASTSDREKIEGYLAWRWGIQASLPIGHPYLSAPP